VIGAAIFTAILGWLLVSLLLGLFLGRMIAVGKGPVGQPQWTSTGLVKGTNMISVRDNEVPLFLTVPGLGNSGPDHWQTLWEQDSDDFQRVELGLWNAPHRTLWVNKLNLAIRATSRPVVLVAHSLGCLAVAWWAKYERPQEGAPVIGALLVAPPEVDAHPLDPRLLPFAPAPMGQLPFRSILVGSRNDPYMKFHRARRLASFWGSSFVDAGAAGHINAESRLGKWHFGKRLLDRLGAGNSDLHSVHPIPASPQQYHAAIDI